MHVASSTVQSGAVGWQIEDLAVMRRRMPVGRNRSDSVAWPCWVLNIITLCLYATRLGIHRANVARCAGSHDKLFKYLFICETLNSSRLSSFKPSLCLRYLSADRNIRNNANWTISGAFLFSPVAACVQWKTERISWCTFSLRFFAQFCNKLAFLV